MRKSCCGSFMIAQVRYEWCLSNWYSLCDGFALITLVRDSECIALIMYYMLVVVAASVKGIYECRRVWTDWRQCLDG